MENGIVAIPSVEIPSSVRLYSEKDSKKIKIEAQGDVVEYVEIISMEGKKLFSSVYPGLNTVSIDWVNKKADFLIVRVVMTSGEVRKKIIF
jgi:hypothetical protein